MLKKKKYKSKAEELRPSAFSLQGGTLPVAKPGPAQASAEPRAEGAGPPAEGVEPRPAGAGPPALSAAASARLLAKKKADNETAWPVKLAAVVDGDIILGGLMMVGGAASSSAGFEQTAN